MPPFKAAVSAVADLGNGLKRDTVIRKVFSERLLDNIPSEAVTREMS